MKCPLVFLLLPYHTLFTIAFPTGNPLQDAGAELQDLTLPTSAATRLSAGSIPRRPPELRITHQYIGTAFLDPLEVYQTAINFLFFESTYGWDYALPRFPVTFHLSNHPSGQVAGIYIQRTKEVPQTRLKTSHVFFALLESISIMSEQGFRPLEVIIHIRNARIGVLGICVMTPRNVLNSKPTTLAFPISNTNNTSPTAVNDDSGVYIDPGNRFAVPYSWSAPRIHSKDIFTCIMEAIIIIAHDGPTSEFTYLNAVSASGNVALNIHATYSPGAEKEIGFVVVRPLLVTVLSFFVDQRRFDSLDFAYEKVQPAGPRIKRIEGFFFRVGNANGQKDNGTAEA